MSKSRQSLASQYASYNSLHGVRVNAFKLTIATCNLLSLWKGCAFPVRQSHTYWLLELIKDARHICCLLQNRTKPAQGMIKLSGPKEPQCVFLTDPHSLIVQKQALYFARKVKETYLPCINAKS